MKSRAKKIAVLVVGWAFILLGIAGLFLPVLQGILCLLIGLFILSSEYVWAHKLLHKMRSRFPAVARQADKAAAKAEEWKRRIFKRGSQATAGSEPDGSGKS
jgi:uncharacterized membrane protein YbaN (DUF454 family)